MTSLPPHMQQRRAALAKRYLVGNGIEIGALDSPLQVPPEASVRYVDRVTVPELRSYYPELKHHDLVEPDIVDDGETLKSFESESLDFIVANHMLEHCENPIGTIERHLHVLRAGGTLFYSVPDKRFSFDRDRAITTFDHLIDDAKDNGIASRHEHYREWAINVNNLRNPEAIEKNALENERNSYSIHFHVWDECAFRAFLDRVAMALHERFGLTHFERSDTEIIAVLKKEDL